MTQRQPPTLNPSDGPPLRALRTTPAPLEVIAPPPRRGGLGALFTLIGFLVVVPPVLAVAAVLLLRVLPPPTTAFMLQSPVKPVRYQWVPNARIAPTVERAVIASEDQKFRFHNGFDMESIEKAMAYNERSGRAKHKQRGASTISQQTAKNLFLWPGGGYARKGVEAALTVLIEACWSKDRILTMYLNIAEFGPGIYGVEAASQAYFQHSAATLSTEEAARLAAVLPAPRKWSADHPGPYVQKRARWILGQMGYGAAPADEPEPELPAEPDSAEINPGEAQDKPRDKSPDAPSETPEGAVPIAPSPAQAPEDLPGGALTPLPPPAPGGHL